MLSPVRFVHPNVKSLMPKIDFEICPSDLATTDWFEMI